MNIFCTQNHVTYKIVICVWKWQHSFQILVLGQCFWECSGAIQDCHGVSLVLMYQHHTSAHWQTHMISHWKQVLPPNLCDLFGKKLYIFPHQLHYFHWILLPGIKSNQIKSNQIKSNQIKSNQIKSNQIKSNQIILFATLGVRLWNIYKHEYSNSNTSKV